MKRAALAVGTRRAREVLFASLGAAALVASCSRDIPLGSDQVGGTAGLAAAGTSGKSGTGGNAGANDAGAAGVNTPECVPASCRGKVYACGNCDDDDEDGRADALDPECTGPCDDLEDSLDVGLPGSSAQSCHQDCFFDRGNGAGNDGCRFSQGCDPLSVAPDYPPSGDAACAYDEDTNIPGGGSCAELRMTQADSCASVCGPLTPNGCDCFGCCELPAGSGEYQSLSSGLACTPVASCLNRCDPCERCVGRLEPLASCTSPSDACDTAYPPCNPGAARLCAGSAYCITGCCIPEPR